MIWSVTLGSLYAPVSHLCLTGLPEVAMPHSDMRQDCRITFPYTRPCYAKSSYRSVDPQTVRGNVHQVDHVPSGPTKSAAIKLVLDLSTREALRWLGSRVVSVLDSVTERPGSGVARNVNWGGAPLPLLTGVLGYNPRKFFEIKDAGR